MDYKIKFRRMLKIKRAEKGIDTDSEFAKRCGWSPANYSNKMSRCNFRFSELEDMANALNCDINIEFIDKE